MVCLLLQSIKLNAHPGGHYHKGDGNVLNTWRLKSGGIIKGNFAFAKENTIFLEQEEGVIKSILITDLSKQDQKLAKFKIEKLNKINAIRINNNQHLPLPNPGFNFKYVPLFLFLFLLLMVKILH